MVERAPLHAALRRHERRVVAFSGGADSAFLARVAHDALGPGRVHAVTAVSPSLPAALLTLRRESPDAYPQKLDLVRVGALVIGCAATASRAACFLDARILGPAPGGAWFRFARVA